MRFRLGRVARCLRQLPIDGRRCTWLPSVARAPPSQLGMAAEDIGQISHKSGRGSPRHDCDG